MKVTKEEVEYIARLAHLEFTAEEALNLAGEFTAILEHFDQLAQEDLSGYGMDTFEKEGLRLREDRVVPFEHFGELFNNTASMAGTAVKIPKVVD
ncbi:MAG: hypothetical protein AVO33_09100 [delta proteobacterium ML8_F1]|nr:MAG: hypothetical protein AVO33_09100 [delta proteobacterium ML8_F1]